MHKLVGQAHRQWSPPSRQRVARLREERRMLNSRLQRVDAELHKLEAEQADKSVPTGAKLDKWFAEITEDLPALPPLPADFSRADLYDDHD